MLEYTGNIILPGVLHHSLVHRKEMHMRESFGERIKRLRIRKNMNQEQVASILKDSSKAISHYENNSREPSLDTLIGMAELYHVSVDYLLGMSFKKSIMKNRSIIHLDGLLPGYMLTKASAQHH